MSKFIIECPACHSFAEASTGFFAKKKINCSCGNVINVRTDKLASRECPHCGNQVVFDQSKGEAAVCPVCHEKINTQALNQQLSSFACAQCGTVLLTGKNASSYTCPVCDHVNDVAERLMAEKIKKEGLASIIKYEGDNNTFIWKHPVEDFNYGSQLIVHESQEAIFFKDGQALDLFGPGRYTLETQQLPLLESVYVLPSDTQRTFHSEVYFINKTVQMAIKWGTPEKVRFIDPLTGTPLEIGASGEMNMQVANARKLLVKLVGTTKGIAWDDRSEFTRSLQASFRPMIANAVKTTLSSVITDNAIDLLEIDGKLDLISESLRQKILPQFEEYGLTIPQLYVTGVLLPENDPNFKRIKELHTITLQTRILQAEATVKTAKAQSETIYRTAEEQSKAAIEAARRTAELERQTTETEIARREAERTVIAAQAEAQAKRMEGLTEAEIMRAKGYSQKDVLQAEVQKAYAEGIGNMGPAVSSGGGSSIIGDMLGLGVGMAAAGVVAPQISGMIQGMSGQSGGLQQQSTGQTPGMDSRQLVYGTVDQNPIISHGLNDPNIESQFNKATIPVPLGSWDCSCGQKGITGKFCSNCGNKKPVPVIRPDAALWECACGQTGNTGRFCSNCGAKKPFPVNKETWDCSCGQAGNQGKFCSNCGSKRPVVTESTETGERTAEGTYEDIEEKTPIQTTWNCSCGHTGNAGNFCDNCGKKKGE